MKSMTISLNYLASAMPKLNKPAMILVVSVSLVFTACNSPATVSPTPTSVTSPEQTSSSSPAATTPTVEPPVITINPGGKTPSVTESLDTILNRANAISQLSYDMFMTEPGQPATKIGKVWIKAKKVRFQSVEEPVFVSIQDSAALTQYTYVPSQKLASQDVFDPEKNSLGVTPTEMAVNIRDSQPVMAGSAMVDGHDCAVLNITDKDGTQGKAWVWKEKGLMLKAEAETPSGKTISEVKNVSFTNIPDSTFQLPADVRMVSLDEIDAAISGTPALTKSFVNSDWSYSLMLPDGWTVDQSKLALVKITNGEVTLMITMASYPGITLSDLTAASSTTLKSGHAGYQETLQKSTLSDGTPAVVVNYTFTPDSAGGLSQGSRLLAINNDSYMLFDITTSDAGWTKYKPTIGSIVNTLVFTKAQTTPGTSSSKTVYSVPAWNYSISVLDGWTVDEKDKSSGHLIIWSPDHMALMEVFAQDVPGANLDTYVNDLVSRYRRDYVGFQEVSRQNVTLSGGLTAYAMVSTRNSSGAPEKELAILTVVGSRQVQVYSRTWLSTWNDYSQGFEQIAYSLVVTSPATK